MISSTKFSSHNVLFIFILAVILFTSCKKEKAVNIVTGEAKVRFTNAIQTESSQEIYLDSEKQNVNPLAFGETSEYIKISSGSREVSFLGISSNTKTTFNFTPSLVYSTFLIADKLGTRSLMNYEVNLSNAELSKVKVRFINLSPSYQTGVNVSVSNGTLFVNALMFKEASNYFSLDTGLNLSIKVVGSGTTKTINAAEFEAGKIYSIWFSGTTAADLEAHLIENN